MDVPSTSYETYVGNTIRGTITCTRNGVAFDLTGMIVYMTGRLTPGASSTVFVLSTGTEGGIVVTDAANGVCAFRIKPSATANLPFVNVTVVNVECDVEVQDPSAPDEPDIWTVHRLTLKLSQDITRV